MLDRKTEPEIHDFDLLTLPKADCRILPNGVPLYVIDMGDQEVNRIDIMFNAGRYEQNVPLAAEAANVEGRLQGTDICRYCRKTRFLRSMVAEFRILSQFIYDTLFAEPEFRRSFVYARVCHL